VKNRRKESLPCAIFVWNSILASALSAPQRAGAADADNLFAGDGEDAVAGGGSDHLAAGKASECGQKGVGFTETEARQRFFLAALALRS
jgi:hypothetical protein